MKLAAGRRQDLDDVATLTARAGARVARRRRRIHARWALSPGADADAAEQLLSGRASEGDPSAQVWTADNRLNLDAVRDDLSHDHLRAWVAGLHERLAGAGLVDAAPVIEATDMGPQTWP